MTQVLVSEDVHNLGQSVGGADGEWVFNHIRSEVDEASLLFLTNLLAFIIELQVLTLEVSSEFAVGQVVCRVHHWELSVKLSGEVLHCLSLLQPKLLRSSFLHFVLDLL